MSKYGNIPGNEEVSIDKDISSIPSTSKYSNIPGTNEFNSVPIMPSSARSTESVPASEAAAYGLSSTVPGINYIGAAAQKYLPDFLLNQREVEESKGKSVPEIAELIRQRANLSKEQNPTSYGAGQIGGALTAALASGGASIPALGAVGAGVGGTQTANQADWANPQQAIRDTVGAAGLGGAGGLAGGTVGAGLSKIASKLGGAFTPAPVAATAVPKLPQKAADFFAAGGKIPNNANNEALLQLAKDRITNTIVGTGKGLVHTKTGGLTALPGARQGIDLAGDKAEELLSPLVGKGVDAVIKKAPGLVAGAGKAVDKLGQWTAEGIDTAGKTIANTAGGVASSLSDYLNTPATSEAESSEKRRVAMANQVVKKD